MGRVETITSATNPLIKEARRAVARGSLTEDGLCVAESFHLLEEALRSDCDVKRIIVAESMRQMVVEHVAGLRNVRVVSIPDKLLRSIPGTEASQGVISFVEPLDWKIDQLFRGTALIVLLDGLQDPGNAGTIVRAAEAFGATGVMFLRGSASPFNPKTLRASAGSLFRLPFLHGLDPNVARAAFRQNRAEMYAAVPALNRDAVLTLDKTDLTRRCGLIVGNEGHGVSPLLRDGAIDVSIPTVAVESLNAAVAASILLYEARRQRALRT